MILAEKIIKLRKQKGWSQEDLAIHMGVSRQSVSKWESMSSLPDLDKIIKLSTLFGVSTDYLLKDDMEEEPGYEANVTNNVSSANCCSTTSSTSPNKTEDIVTAAYLGYSFLTMDWGRSWIVWPVAGVLYAAVVTIANSARKQ